MPALLKAAATDLGASTCSRRYCPNVTRGDEFADEAAERLWQVEWLVTELEVDASIIASLLICSAMVASDWAKALSVQRV
ncbi:hypothetical protein [Streptomyces sp. NPDC002855]|uniref:hypothetical protein n=1 Tax=Streptomyces sp. NPDC002855 TaxID=3154437 RepID=UPI003329B77E